MASWKILVVAVVLGNVVTGLSFGSTDDDDDQDDTFGYLSEQPLMMFHALPLPIPPMLLPRFDQMFPPMTFLPIREPTPPTPPTPFRHHRFHHKFPKHHDFPDFLTADSILDDKPNSNENIAGMSVMTTSGDGANDGTTMVTNNDGVVESASTGKAHNMRHRIKVPKMKKTPGNHQISFSKSESSSTIIKDGKKKSEAASSTTAVNDGKVEHQDTMMKKKDNDFINDDDNEDDNKDDNDDFNMNMKPKMLNLDFPDLSAAAIMDAKPGDDEEVAGYAIRNTSGTGKDGTTMVTNEDGNVKTGKTGNASHDMRKNIEPMKMNSGPGTHSTSFSTSSSSSIRTVNGKSVSEGESSTTATSDGVVESEQTKMKRKDKGYKDYE